MFERLVAYLEGAEDSFIKECMYLVEVFTNINLTQRVKDGKEDFILGFEKGMKEPLGFSEESEYVEDKAVYLLGKIIGNRLTIPYLIEMAGTKISEKTQGNGGVVAAGAVMSKPSVPPKALLVAGGLLAVTLTVVSISSENHFIENCLEFAFSLENEEDGSSNDDSSGDTNDDKASEPTSPSQLQGQVKRGQAPKEVDRVDKPHVHFKDGT